MYANPPRQGGSGPAVFVGFGAMFAGAAVMTVVDAVTKHDYRPVGLLVGVIVGGAILLTRPRSQGVALLAGLFAFLGCMMGRFFAVGWLVSHDSNGSVSLVPMLKLEAKHPADLYWHGVTLLYVFWFGAAAIAVILTAWRVARVNRAAPSVGGSGYGAPVQGYPAFGAGQPAQGGPGFGAVPQGGPGYGPPQGQPGYGPPQGGPGYGPPQGQPGYGGPQYPQGRG